MKPVIFISLLFMLLAIGQLVNGQRRNARINSKVLSPEECDKVMLKADNCFKPIMLLTYDTLPLNEREYQEVYCKPLNQRLACVTEVRNCFSGFLKTVFDMIMRGIRAHFRGYCKTKLDRERFIYEGECVQNLKEVQKFVRLYNNELADILAFTSSFNDDVMIQNACCLYDYLNIRLLNITTTYCKANGVTEDVGRIKFFNSVIAKVFAEIIDVVCPASHKTYAGCKKQVPEMMETIEKIASQNDSSPRNTTALYGLRSFAEALAKLFD